MTATSSSTGPIRIICSDSRSGARVRARWDAAEARETLLAVQAGRMSTPILEHLGFHQIATVHALVDRS